MIALKKFHSIILQSFPKLEQRLTCFLTLSISFILLWHFIGMLDSLIVLFCLIVVMFFLLLLIWSLSKTFENREIYEIILVVFLFFSLVFLFLGYVCSGSLSGMIRSFFEHFFENNRTVDECIKISSLFLGFFSCLSIYELFRKSPFISCVWVFGGTAFLIFLSLTLRTVCMFSK